MKDLTLAWILEGYRIFAEKGPSALKVEALARKVGKNKSSFYHHFADMEVFKEFLLNYHLDRADMLAEKEASCKNVDPELFEVLIEFQEDLFFNRQLRVNREHLAFHKCCEKANQKVAGAIIDIWAEALGLIGKNHLALMVLRLSLENFYLQITPENMNLAWLRNYMQELRSMVQAFQQAEKGTRTSLQS
ncbi:MAG: helix-turn-helix domain-containing protein [Bacteroidota bacterium]